MDRRNKLAQVRLEVAQHSHDPLAAEKQRREGHLVGIALARWAEAEFEIEFDERVIGMGGLYIQSWRPIFRSQILLPSKEHLKERRMVRALFWLKEFDDLIKGQLMMRVGTQHPAFYLFQQLRSRRVLAPIDSQCQRIGRIAKRLGLSDRKWALKIPIISGEGKYEAGIQVASVLH